jgi:GNAT superfamily N-acetyltransferase
MRQVPNQRQRMEALFRDAGVTGWLVIGADDPDFKGQQLDDPVGVHTGTMTDVLERSGSAGAVPGLEIRRVDPDDSADVARWAELFIAGFEVDEPIDDAWRRFTPSLVRARGQQQFIGSLDGRDVAASAMFNRRRVTWLGAGTVLPEARGRGIQRALIADRAVRGAEAGSLRVMATADVDSVSAANLEALGIERIWTRALARVNTMPG